MLHIPARLSADEYCRAVLDTDSTVLGMTVLARDSAMCSNLASQLAAMRVLGHGSYSVVLTNERAVYKISFFQNGSFIAKEALLGLYFARAVVAKDPATRWFVVPSYPAGVWLPTAEDARVWSGSVGFKRGRMVSAMLCSAATHYGVGQECVPCIDVTDVLPLDAALTVRTMFIGAQHQQVRDAVVDNTYVRDVVLYSQKQASRFQGYIIQQQEFAGASTLKSVLPHWFSTPPSTLGVFLFMVFGILDRLHTIAGGFVHMDLGTPNIVVADLAKMPYKAAEYYNQFKINGRSAPSLVFGAVPRIIDLQMSYVDTSTACSDLGLSAPMTARVSRVLEPPIRPFYGTEDVRRLGLWLLFDMVQRVGEYQKSVNVAAILLAMHMITFRQPWFDAAATAGESYAEFALILIAVYRFVRQMLEHRLGLPGAPALAKWSLASEAKVCLDRIVKLLENLNYFMCHLATAAGVQYEILVECERDFRPGALARSVHLHRCIAIE